MTMSMTPRERIRLAVAAMGNDERARARLIAAGYPASTVAALYATMRAAHETMSPVEQAADAARTEAELDAIVNGTGIA